MTGMEIDIIEHAGGLVPGPGFYNMPAAVYHADCAPEPSLSASVAVEIIAKTPRHGQIVHPRLNGSGAVPPDGDVHQVDDEATPAMDAGSVIHELLLGKGGGFVALPFKDFRTKDAKAARAEAIAAGKTPIIAGKFEIAQRLADVVRKRLPLIPGAESALEAGGSETVLVWRDATGIWGRAMVDRWGPTPFEIWDIKTTTAGLSDRALGTRVADGIDIKAAWYCRGLTRLWPELAGRHRYRLIWVEQAEPFEVRVTELPAEAWHVGNRKAVTAAVLFRHGLATGIWPGYANEITPIDYPAWAAPQWEAREMVDPLLRGLGSELVLAHSPFAPSNREIAA